MNKIKTRDKNFIRKGERGSVTLFVLIAMMFFLTVGVGVYMANVNTQQAQQKGVKKVQLEYSSTDNIDNIYKDQVEKLGQKLIIVVKDSEKNIYQEGTWTNKLPLTIIANWPDGTKDGEKEVSLTSPSKVTTTYNFDKENTALILYNNNIENGKWTAQVEVGGKKQSVEIWIDTIAPTCTITAEPDKNPTNADSITFTLKNEDLFSGLVSDIDYSKLENIITVTDKNNNKLENGSDVTWDWIENENNKVKFTINKDDFEGNIKITIPAGTLTDNAGNTSEEITKEVKIDKKAPTCTITANPDKNPTNASSIVYTFKWSEEVTGFTTEDITVTNGTKGIFTAKSATEYTLAVTTQANQNNTQTINVAAGKCTDIAGNGNIAVNKEVKIDRVTPTCIITANPDKSPTNASSITYTFKWSEEVTGFTTEDITVTNGTKGTFTKTSGTVYTLVVTTQANQDNTQTINVAAGKCTDIAGNENAAISKEVKIDRKSPTCTITANPNKSPTNASSITYTFTWSEEVTGFTTEDITVTNGTKGTFTKTSGTVYTLVVTTAAKQDNTQKVVINTNVCTDVVENGNIATSKEVKIDRKAPTATSCEVKNITATGYDVYVYGVTDSTGVDRVLFPTWTQNNGQDDIQANWWETTNDTAKGENLGNGTWHYRVNVTDHKNEYGTYTTHVYTYDTLGNKQICSSTNIEVPAVNITYLSDNLVYGLENRSSTTDHNMTYSISNGVVTVTANASDGWGNTTGRVYLEANTQYEFTCTTSATSGTWGNSVEAFLLLNGSTSTYIRMDSNNNYRFTPAQSGTYYIRLDVNTSGKTYTFSNIDIRKVVLTETKNYGLTLATLPAYSRTGYTFNGWFTAKTGGTKIATTTPVPGVNTTYYAQTKANTYTVKYDGNGATSGSTASSSHTYNVAKALTTNGFARTGYTFNGWNTKADGTGTSYANSASVTNLTSTNGATVTLYAQWKINQYNIDLNYNVDGTTYWSGYQGRIKAGLKIGGVDKGYVADYGGSSNYGTSWEIYGLQLDGVNVAYTQKGTLGASNLNLLVYFYTISFKADSATYGSVSASSVIVPKNNTTYSTSDKTFKLSDGRTVTASTKSVTGYTSNFTGWSSTTGTITAATSITAKFSGTLITYKIGYTLNGGTVSGNPTSYNITTNTITLKNPTRTGYTFAGWTGSNGTTKQTTVTIPKGSTGNKTYTANWTANNYKILFDSNGGTGTMASISTQYGKDTTLTANAFSKKYTVKYSTNGGNAVSDSVANQLFMGWTLGGKNMYEFTNLRNVSNTTINSDGTLTINKSNTTSSTIWSNLFFKSNSEIEANTNYVAILDVKSKTNTGSPAYYPSSDNGTDTAQIASASTVSINNIGIGRNYINIKSKSTTTGHSNLTRSFWTIYANASLNIKFRPILVKGTYSNIPLYYYNSGVARDLTSTNNGSVTLYADWGQPTITLPTPTRTGYTFAGWYSDSGLTSKIGNGGSTYRPAKDITLYAKWTANTYTVKYDGNGATVGSTESSSHTYNVAKALTANEFVKIGYTFNGWNTKADGTGTSYANSASVTNLASTNGATVTLYAKWTATTYPISYVGAATSVSSYTINTATFTLTNPTKTGYTFKGWTEKILLKRWYSGFTNYNTGAVEKNTTYPNSVFSEFIYLKANTTYTLTGTNLGNIRWRIYNLDGTYNSNASTSTTCKPTANCYASILLYDGCTEANRTAAYITTSGNITSVSIPKGSTGNRSYTSNFADETAPTVTFGTNGNTTYAKSQSTTVTVTDSGSGVNTSSLKYQWTQSTTAPAESTFSTTFTSGKAITKNTGTGSNWYLWILAKDNAGNKTIKRSNAFYLDNTAPTVTQTGTTTTAGVSTAKNQRVLGLTDNESGVNYWAVTTTTTAPTSTSSTNTTKSSTTNTWFPVSVSKSVGVFFTPNSEGTYYIWVKDVAGNGATTYAGSFTVKPANYYIYGTSISPYYETTLKEACNSTNDTYNIKVLNSVTETEEANIKAEKNVTIDMNGKSIKYNGRVILNNGTLSVTNSGTIECTGERNVAIQVGSNATVSISSSTIKGTFAGIGSYFSEGNVIINSGTISGGDFGINCSGVSQNITINWGVVEATAEDGVGVAFGNTGTLTIGKSTDGLNTGLPHIKGGKYAISGREDYKAVNFYNGMLTGGTDRLINECLITRVRGGYMVHLDNTTSTTEHSAYLVKVDTSSNIPVAEIGDVKYHTMQSAIECSGKNAEITQIANINQTTKVARISSGSIVTWKGNGYTCDAGSATVIENYGSLKLVNVKATSTTTVVYSYTGSSLYLGNSEITASSSGYAISLQGKADLTATGYVKITGVAAGIYKPSSSEISVISLSNLVWVAGKTGMNLQGAANIKLAGVNIKGTSGAGITFREGTLEYEKTNANKYAISQGISGVTYGIDGTKGTVTINDSTNNIDVSASGATGKGIDMTSGTVNIIGGMIRANGTSGVGINVTTGTIVLGTDTSTSTTVPNVTGTSVALKTAGGNVIVKSGKVIATGTAAPAIQATTGNITIGVDDGTVSKTSPAITGNGAAAIVKTNTTTGKISVYDGVLTGSTIAIGISANATTAYTGTITVPSGYKLDITKSPATLTK